MSLYNIIYILMQTINNHEEALFKQLDILLVNEPDTSRNGDKYLDWKNVLSEVREQIDALHQDPGWDNVHESSQAERATKQSRRHSRNVRTPRPQHQRDHEAVVEALRARKIREHEAQARLDQVRAQTQERFLKFLHGFAGAAAS